MSWVWVWVWVWVLYDYGYGYEYSYVYETLICVPFLCPHLPTYYFVWNYNTKFIANYRYVYKLSIIVVSISISMLMGITIAMSIVMCLKHLFVSLFYVHTYKLSVLYEIIILSIL